MIGVEGGCTVGGGGVVRRCVGGGVGCVWWFGDVVVEFGGRVGDACCVDAC